MNTIRLVLLTIVLVLPGCASLSQFSEKHPIASAVGGTLIAGSIMATVNINSHHDRATDPQARHGNKPCEATGGC